MDDIRKPRSLVAKGDGWSHDSSSRKHFRVNGAVPDERPSTATSKAGRSKTCKKSPDHAHHNEIVVERVYVWYEVMVHACAFCGHKDRQFYVRTHPVPEWVRNNPWSRRFWGID